MNERDKFIFGLDCGYAYGLSGKFARPGSKPSYAPDQDFDTEHILLELELNFQNKSVSGRCTTTFRAINEGAKEINFDAARLKIGSVRLQTGQRLKNSYDAK